MSKFFISYTGNDSQKAQWIGWTLGDLGHEAFVHEWEVAGGGNIPAWMEQRLEDCDHFIGVFSPDYIDAKYSKSERLAVYWKDAIGRDGFLMPVVIRPCELPILVQPLKRLEIAGCDRDEARSRLEKFITPPTAPESEPPFEGVAIGGQATEPEPPFEPAATAYNPRRFEINRLPTPHSSDLIGRESEKALLTSEWDNRERRNILALIAEGGTGKSFLVSRWLAELKDKKPAPYAGAGRIFTWSFYSQGSKGQVTSSEGFFSELLRSFGVDPESYDSLGKADKALELVCRETMILVLDGVEPLQNPPNHPDAGRFHDRTMGDFVNRLAGQPWPGLVIVTSRQRLAEMAAQEGQAVRHVVVDTFKPEDGAALLTSLGVTGPEEEKQKASVEMSGHAFGLVLLGRYLVDMIGDGDIAKRDQVKLLDANLPGADKAKAMLQAYADRFGTKSAETAMLHLLGLFDRPVPLAALHALVAAPVIAGLTDPFDGADAPPLNMVLRNLEELKLITRPDAETVDGHPLVREHFGAVLEQQSPEGWREANSRLFDYFRSIPEMDQPDSETGLMPLYQSLHHGVAAGRAQEALNEVYYRRIARGGDVAYGVKQLGLFSTELAALAAFFPGGWQAPLQEVTRRHQGYLLNHAGFRLRALGRLKEAQEPFELQIAICIELGDDSNAAVNSNNMSQLLLVQGELQAALERANDAVDFIDKTRNKFRQSAYRGQLANVLAHQGKLKEAVALFEEAEYRHRQDRPHERYLYSMHGFLYSSFLLRTTAASVLPGLAERTQATLKIAERSGLLLSIALDSLNLARIAARAGDSTAAAQFDSAITALQKAVQRQELPRGYLARANFRRAQGHLAGAWDDLAEVRHIADPSGMRLYLCDALIEEAWLHHLSGEAEKARAAFEQAESEINAMGYHWQDDELAKLRKALD